MSDFRFRFLRSDMSQSQLDTSQPNHAEEVLDVIFPARDQPLKPMQPG